MAFTGLKLICKFVLLNKGYFMKNIGFSLCLTLIIIIAGCSDNHGYDRSSCARAKISLDKNWKFHLGDASSPDGDFGYGTGMLFGKAGEAVGAIDTTFKVSSWRTVDLPHDWAVELDFLNVKDRNLRDHGYKPVGRLYPKTSIGWYRHAFNIPSTDRGKRLALKFDGVFRDSKVWLNGHYMGSHMSGYSEFVYDITDYVKFGGNNVIVLRADASQYEGWFYEGAGIYRHVWLEKFNPVHIPQYGVFVHTENTVSTAKVTVETTIDNGLDSIAGCELLSVIRDDAGNTVAESKKHCIQIPRLSVKAICQEIRIRDPKLWSLESPSLYTLTSFVLSKNKIIDSITTSFGIRTLVFDKDKGLFLNGKQVKIQGVCCHQDHSGVGSALPDRLQYYRIEKLKEMGCNAYRTSHNPPANELLDACDRLGMLVLDENRLMESSPELLAEFERLVLRDRNHPCVFMWSLGNEEYKIQDNETGKRIATTLSQQLTKLDPTRLFSYAANNGNQYRGVNEIVPVRGFNYMNIMDIDKYRRDHPDQVLMGSEEASTVCTRGIYTTDTVKGYLCDYDINKPGWGATAEQWWKFYESRDWLMGAFAWTGFDYRGEPTPYDWPCISSHFGIMDMCGFPKNNYYYYQSWWSGRDVLHIFPHWNRKGKEGEKVSVWCNTNCESVELFLNGKSLGRKNVVPNAHLEWNVIYEPGVLEAKGTRHGKTLTDRVETTGKPAVIMLTPDRAAIQSGGRDVCIVNVTVTDDKGLEVPEASDLITFRTEGGGKITGVGNGDPSSHEPDKCMDGNWQRHLFSGKCQVIVQSGEQPGQVILEASAAGLKPAQVRIKTDITPHK
jgi:beta-galactosidase